MWKMPVAVLVLLTWLAGPASALELKNLRATYGPFGKERADNKFLPGDAVFVYFEMTDIQADPKTHIAHFQIVMDLLDSKGNLIFNQNKSDQAELALGGNQLPTFADVVLGIDQQPGKYSLKLTVRDLLAKTTKEISYGLEVLPANFGVVRVFSPAAGFTGTNNMVTFAVIGMGRDSKNRPNVDVHMRVLDDAGKAMKSATFLIPKDLPDESLSKIEASKFLDLQFPFFLNRPGRFTIEVEAIDTLAKKTSTVRLPLTVVDISSIGAK
jgi:hypothetical protein